MNSPKIAVITVIANSKKWLEAYYESLSKTKYSNYFVIIVDNASEDGGASFLLEKSHNVNKKIKIIRNSKNLGFARANNIAIKYALDRGVDYIALLNPDTKVEPFWLSTLVQVAESESEIGILSPLQYDYDADRVNNLFMTIFDLESSIFQDIEHGILKDKYATKQVVGAAVLIKKSVFMTIGYFDTLFFLYGEEYDFCRRALFNNFKIYVVAKSIIHHWSAFSCPNSLSRMKEYYYRRGNFLYFLKNPNIFFPKLVCGYYLWHMLKIARRLKLFKSLSSIVDFFVFQLWILWHLPLIAFRHYVESRLKRVQTNK